jgi:hypothetical protein
MPEILMIPGYTNSGPEHWRTLWESRLPSTRRVHQRELNRPDRREWICAVDRNGSASVPEHNRDERGRSLRHK